MSDSQRSARVLVVEDNPLNLELVADILESRGWSVLTAVGGQEALETVRAERPELVLMDIQLPGIDGLEVTRRIKADPASATIPVIALTAHAMRGDEESIYEAGCDGYIAKPIQISAFIDVVNRHLKAIEDGK